MVVIVASTGTLSRSLRTYTKRDFEIRQRSYFASGSFDG